MIIVNITHGITIIATCGIQKWMEEVYVECGQKGEKMSDLKPCPFCGAEAHLVHNAKRKIYGRDAYAFGNVAACTNCGAEIFSSIGRAEELWNRRTREYDEYEAYG